ncbi:MAG: peptide chain release factor N(5)-glutamine methyltransferase [Rhizobiaceae bacterium]
MPDQPTIETWIRQAAKRLAERKIPTPDLDAKILLCEATGLSSAGIISNSRELLDAENVIRAEAFLQRRESGEPVHRILGRREFYGREFQLSADTLVPRPDTETLIEVVLGQMKNVGENVNILDIGTGSGVIAVTLAAELPAARVVASDISPNALSTAAENANRHGVECRIEFILSDVYSKINGQFDFIVSNPPYIPNGEIDTLENEVRLHDPYRALAGGEDGLNFYHTIFSEGRKHLSDSGVIILETGANQSDAVCALAAAHGYVKIGKFSDLCGVNRVVNACIR